VKPMDTALQSSATSAVHCGSQQKEKMNDRRFIR
jgi:hypothetical protein